MASNVKFEIIQHLCVLSDKGNGWRKECNLVRWNDGVPKFDVREWAPDRSAMSKGITFTRKEFSVLQSSIRYVKVSQWDRMLREMEKSEQSASSEPPLNSEAPVSSELQFSSESPISPEPPADSAPENIVLVPTLPIDSDSGTLPEEKMASGM